MRLATASKSTEIGYQESARDVRIYVGKHFTRLPGEQLAPTVARCLPRLERDFDLDPFTFGQGVAQLPHPQPAATNSARKIEDYTWIDKLAPSSPLTPIGDSLREVINRKRGQPLAGVVLVTDGANNSGTQPREVAALLRQEGVPLYIYGVGITSPRDITVRAFPVTS